MSLIVFSPQRGDVDIGGNRGVWRRTTGAPVNGTSGTFANEAIAGDLLIDTTNLTLYQNLGTSASPTWTLSSLASAAGAISAAGTSSQSAATPLTKDFNQVGTAAANSGVALPVAVAGRRVVIANYGANTLKIWPINGGTDIIDALSANTNTTLTTANRIATFYCFVTGTWVSALGGAVAS